MPENHDLRSIPGVGPDAAKRLIGAGLPSYEHLQLASHEEIRKALGGQNALAARIKADVGDATMDEVLEQGMEVRDRENSGLWMITVSNPYGTAGTVTVNAYVDGENKDVAIAEFPTNEAYPEDDRVIDCVSVGSLKTDALKKGNSVTVYTYPVSRLDLMWGSQATDNEPPNAAIESKEIEGKGGCETCDSAVIGTQEEYISHGDNVFCDIDCYNKWLQ